MLKPITKGIAVATLLSLFLVTCKARQDGGGSVAPVRRAPTPGKPSLTVASWGGAYQEAQRKAFFQPFEAETGVHIIETATPDYGKFYEWQKAGSASVDVADVETYFVFEASRKGALRRLDPATKDGADLIPTAAHDYGLASCAYADVIAWNSQRHPDWKDVTWGQFWDTKSLPGTRGLRDLPASTLEAALLADGVARDGLYPLDARRAFRSLTTLRSKAKVALWSSGSQPIERLLTGAVELTTAWNGRVFDAQKEGKPVAMTFNNGMIDWLWWVIPANAEHADLAEKFIAFTLRADRQAELARHIPYGPTNRAALPMLDAATIELLPTAPNNLAKLIVRDNQWWADHSEQLQPPWREWKLDLNNR